MIEGQIQPFEDAPPDDVPIRGYLHVPAKASRDAIVVTHGAGSNCNLPLLVALANGFCDGGVTVLWCDPSSRQLRPQGPCVGARLRRVFRLPQACAAICRGIAESPLARISHQKFIKRGSTVKFREIRLQCDKEASREG